MQVTNVMATLEDNKPFIHLLESETPWPLPGRGFIQGSPAYTILLQHRFVFVCIQCAYNVQDIPVLQEVYPHRP